MLVSKYLDSIEGTEKEQLFFNSFKELTENEEVATGLAKARKTPVVGKVIGAIVALADAESIAEFKQTGHYDNIKDWSITVHDLEKGLFSIYPGPKHLKMILPVIAAITLGILFLYVRRKCIVRIRK